MALMAAWRMENVLRNAEYRKRRRAEELKSARFIFNELEELAQANDQANAVRPYRKGYVNNIYDARKFSEEDESNDKRFLSLALQQEQAALPNPTIAKVRDIKLKQVTMENLPMGPSIYPRHSIYQEHFTNHSHSRPYIYPPPVDSAIFSNKPDANQESQQSKGRNTLRSAVSCGEVDYWKHGATVEEESEESSKTLYQEDFTHYNSPRPFIRPRPQDSVIFLDDNLLERNGKPVKSRSFMDDFKIRKEGEPTKLLARVKSANARSASNRLMNGFERSSIPLVGEDDNVNQATCQSVMQADYTAALPVSKPQRVRAPFPPYNPISHTQEMFGKDDVQLPRLSRASTAGSLKETDRQAEHNRAMAKMRKFESLSTHLVLGRSTPTCVTEYNSCYSYL